MKLGKDDKLGQGRGAFNPVTRVQIPKGANDICDGNLGFGKKKQSKRSTRKDGFEYKRFLGNFQEVVNRLPQKKMDRLRIELLKAYKKRYKKSGTPKYGTLSKSFTELELQHFLRNVPNDKFRLLFKYQAYLGLRIGEVTKLHISNIDFEK